MQLATQYQDNGDDGNDGDDGDHDSNEEEEVEEKATMICRAAPPALLSGT